MKRILLATAFCAAAAQISSAQFYPGVASDPNKINWQLLTSGVKSRIKTEGITEITTGGDLERYWARLTGQDVRTAPKGVDWVRNKVLAITLGERETGGYSVFVRSIERGSGNATVVTATEKTPMPGQYVAKGATAPFILVRVDRHPGNFVLNWSQPVENGNLLFPPNYGGGYNNGYDYGNNDGNPPSLLDDGAEEIWWRGLDQGSNCRVQGQSFTIVENADQMRKVYTKLFGRFTPLNESFAERMNWQKEKLVVVTLGQRSSGGYGINVRGVFTNPNGRTVVKATETAPRPGQLRTMEMSSPFVILRVDARATQIQLDLGLPR